MKLIFVCPNKNKVFESSDFKIYNYGGIITDDAGDKTLDAEIALDHPCPHCGREHVYRVGELSCPFKG